MPKSILIADDNDGIVDILSTYLIKAGYFPIKAGDGESAISKFEQYKPALILLDIMMPKIDGLQVCREIRKVSNVPIIMITALGEDANKIMGLEIGADDYVVKPFSPAEVIARIGAVLRRIDLTDEDKNDIVSFAELEINIADYEVKYKQNLIPLTKKEIEILWILAKSPNKVFSRDNLLNLIWGYQYYGDSRIVDTHIKRLRAKLNINNQSQCEIKTIWGGWI